MGKKSRGCKKADLEGGVYTLEIPKSDLGGGEIKLGGEGNAICELWAQVRWVRTEKKAVRIEKK
jgi:hypothetical protein